ncbi:hypothetical protein CcaverHIS002_0412020 [Cutaneotrichosporon cavernicola]|nr:hypothetical protein CcaverHIS002_0412020 [Cutaneotrichosporon cavernicola]
MSTDGTALQAKVTQLFTQLNQSKSSRRAKVATVAVRREAVKAACNELSNAQQDLLKENATLTNIQAEFERAQASLTAFDHHTAEKAHRRTNGYRTALEAALEESADVDISLGDISGVGREAES